jgi:hypothetical protein
MNRVSAKLGFWSSLGSAILFLLFTVCFVAVVIGNPKFTWTNISDYVAFTQSYDQAFKYIAQTAMLLFAPLYVLILSSIHDFTEAEMKPLSRAALAFGIVFATLASLNYFVQISAVRLNIDKGHIEGIEQFIQSRPDAVITAINMLGWTLFLGLSSLLVAPVFSQGTLGRALRILFALNGTICLLAGIGFVVDNVVLVFLAINFGMGGTVTAITDVLPRQEVEP